MRKLKPWRRLGDEPAGLQIFQSFPQPRASRALTDEDQVMRQHGGVASVLIYKLADGLSHRLPWLLRHLNKATRGEVRSRSRRA